MRVRLAGEYRERQGLSDALSDPGTSVNPRERAERSETSQWRVLATAESEVMNQEPEPLTNVAPTSRTEGFVLALNAGSSSLKFALIGGGTVPVRILSGAVDRIGLPEATFSLRKIESQQTEHARVSAPNHASCLDYLLKRLAETTGAAGFRALGHRVVHGGGRYTQPQLVTPDPMEELRRITCFAPEHLPAEIALIAALSERFPNLPAEWDYGDYEGQRSVDIHKARPDWNLFRDGCPSGESPAQVSDRADRFIARLRALEGNVALFSHGHFGRVLAARWIGSLVSQAQHLLLSTASISILSYEHNHADEPVIALWNAGSREVFGDIASAIEPKPCRP